jgi:hypothetical protein
MKADHVEELPLKLDALGLLLRRHDVLSLTGFHHGPVQDRHTRTTKVGEHVDTDMRVQLLLMGGEADRIGEIGEWVYVGGPIAISGIEGPRVFRTGA